MTPRSGPSRLGWGLQRGFRRGLRRLLSGLGLIALTTAATAAQEPIPLDDFDGWETWPLVEPGDLDLATGRLSPLRIELDGLFPGPQGFGVPPLDTLTMYMDVRESSFHGAAALWIQWVSKPIPGETRAPALDELLVDLTTFRLLFRVAASARGDWAGRYELIQARPEGVIQVGVGEDGDASEDRLDAPADYFDFAAYPFLFPLLDLREGLALRLSGYDYLEKRAEILPMRVVGRTTVEDAKGRPHQVWRVDVMPSHRATLISFYVSKEPPFFYGWDYRLTRDGSMAVRLTLRDWLPTTMR